MVIGTVMDFRDLYHELAGLNDPAHKNETRWYHPKHDFHVIRMKALIDEETETDVWWRAEFAVVNPVTHYRFLLTGGDAGYLWVTAAGT